MILILLGTSKFKFTRPLIELDELCHKGIVNDRIIVQSGCNIYESEYFETVSFFNAEELNDLIIRADLIITHAGTGSVLGALKKHKKIIAIPRLQEFGEAIDNHQIDLVNEFSKTGYIIPWYKDDSLIDLINKSKTFMPVPYISYKEKIIEYIINYINEL